MEIVFDITLILMVVIAIIVFDKFYNKFDKNNDGVIDLYQEYIDKLKLRFGNQFVEEVELFMKSRVNNSTSQLINNYNSENGTSFKDIEDVIYHMMSTQYKLDEKYAKETVQTLIAVHNFSKMKHMNK